MRRLERLATSLALGVALGASGQAAETVGGWPPSEALRLGERMYREGILPDGAPMQARVQGDVPVNGRMFSCVSCHLRSGLGSREGGIASRAINGAKLFRPLLRASEHRVRPGETLPDRVERSQLRPAYTEASLAQAIREGKDAAGRPLHGAMPRYSLEDRDLDVLVHYLKHLSAERPPGVTDETLRLATVVAGDVDPAEREAMLAALGAHVRDRNAQSRNDAARGRKASFFTDYAYATYRSLELRIWEVRGPPGTWKEQLDRLSRDEPAFALVGGLAAGPWQPIHEFCEESRLPCLFPATDRPVTTGPNAYTLYFSRGPRQEGETAARFLWRASESRSKPRVVQVWRSRPEVLALAAGFEEAWTKLSGAAPIAVVVPREQVLDSAFWDDLRAAHPGADFALWLGVTDLSALTALATPPRPSAVIVSGGLLGSRLADLPVETRSFAYATYPFSLPDDERKREAFVEGWLRTRGLAMTHPRLQARMYFVGWMLSAALSRMRGELYRDYLLDVLDMMADETFAIALYPRLSFGPGQRYASKGCYVVQLGPGRAPRLEPRTDWVVH